MQVELRDMSFASTRDKIKQPAPPYRPLPFPSRTVQAGALRGMPSAKKGGWRRPGSLGIPALAPAAWRRNAIGVSLPSAQRQKPQDARQLLSRASGNGRSVPAPRDRLGATAAATSTSATSASATSASSASASSKSGNISVSTPFSSSHSPGSPKVNLPPVRLSDGFIDLNESPWMAKELHNLVTTNDKQTHSHTHMHLFFTE